MRLLRKSALPACMALAWEITAHSGIFSQLFMPSLEAIAARVVQLLSNGVLLNAVAASLSRLVSGFSLGLIIGIAGGVALTRLGIMEGMAGRLIAALLASPVVAWTSLFVLWFGIGGPATTALVTFSSSLPIMLNTWLGLRQTDPIFARVADFLEVGRIRRIISVTVPAASVSIFTGARLGFAQGWHALVAGEMLAGATHGLGVLIVNGRTFLDTPAMITGVATIGVLAYTTEVVVFGLIERRTLIRWGLTRR
ncbi:MAG TPA: ABC transporter permease subunit [Streptosporangiaceae bacterium]|nr:ABC transporter permease subunit [Streptosporangiaceae bacterium]